MQYLSHRIVEDMVEAGIEPIITKNGLIVHGFYKSSTILLVPVQDRNLFVAKARYDETTPIESFDDLVRLNYDWWQRSKSRFEGLAQPGPKWGKEMARLGLVEATIIPEKIIYE